MYIDKFLKLKTLTQLEDELTAIIFWKGVNLAMKDLLKHHLLTLSLDRNDKLNTKKVKGNNGPRKKDPKVQ